MKIQVEVGIFSCHKWKFRHLQLSDSRHIREGNQQPGITAPQPTSTSISLKKVANWDGTFQDIEQVLSTAFKAEDYLDCIKDLESHNIITQTYIDNLDKVCSYSTPKYHTRT
jgi:hypothetical protein